MKALLFVVLLIFVSPRVMACDDSCIVVLDISNPTEERFNQIDIKYQHLKPTVIMLEAAGHDPWQYARETGNSELLAYHAELQAADREWFEKMLAAWTGEVSDNEQVMWKIFNRAYTSCRKMCY